MQTLQSVLRARAMYAAIRRAQAALGDARAHGLVHRAIRRGQIPPVLTCCCVDCGLRAEHYDHRDYAKPLSVEPVCRSCNKRRGPGRPLDPEGYALLRVRAKHLWTEFHAWSAARQATYERRIQRLAVARSGAVA